MELLFIGLAFGAITAYFIFSRFAGGRKSSKTKEQSVILMEKIRSVCKFITIEGDFSEIYHYEDVKEKWFSLVTGKKRALILIEAKAHIGFDLSQIKMEANLRKKLIKLTNFPQPKLLSIDTDFNYYDKKEGWANPFTASDLTEVHKSAKQHIVDKIPSSGLMEDASKQALETIQLLEKLAETINWNMDYSALIIQERSYNLPQKK